MFYAEFFVFLYLMTLAFRRIITFDDLLPMELFREQMILFNLVDPNQFTCTPPYLNGGVSVNMKTRKHGSQSSRETQNRPRKIKTRAPVSFR